MEFSRTYQRALRRVYKAGFSGLRFRFGRRVESSWLAPGERAAIPETAERDFSFDCDTSATERVFLLRQCFSLGSDTALGASQVVWNVHPCDPRDPWRVPVDKRSF